MKKVDFKIIVILILSIVLILMGVSYFKKDTNTINQKQTSFANREEKYDLDQETNTETTTVTIKATSEVKSALTEKIGLHATYALQESYLEEKQEVEAGKNLLKYTNGIYMTAPYSCIIDEIQIPEVGEICTNTHYLQIESTDLLAVELSVDETKVNKLSIGQEAEITVIALENKVVQGNITQISSTATNGKFTAQVEFENDGEIKIGMTANVVI